jgi:hypothetical protein
MTFPAHQSFDTDDRVSARLLRVYAWCRLHLDFVEPRPAKLVSVSHGVRLAENKCSSALRWLTDAGYLVRPPRHIGAPNRNTNAWSLSSDRRPTLTQTGTRQTTPCDRAA